MKRVFLFMILLFLSLCLQILLTGWGKNIKVDLFLLLTVFWSHSRGWKEGTLAGFSCGILKDIFFSPVLGINAFSFVLIGWLIGNFFQSKLYQENLVIVLLIVASSSLFHSTILSAWLTALYRFSFPSSFLTSFYPVLLYNCGFSFAIFMVKETFCKKLTR